MYTCTYHAWLRCQVTLVVMVVGPLVVGTVGVPKASGVAFIGYGGKNPPPTNLIATPNRIYSWDPGVITWKMDSDFTAYFPTSVLQNQVRLAFKEWESASTSAIKRAVPNYSWDRYKGQQDFVDLRTVINHEIGHAVGSQHPDASWFNSNLMRNYLPDGNGGWVAGPPLGGELMNEGNRPNSLPNQKPDAGLRGGEYHRLVSKDELAMLDHAYGAKLEFVEVGQEDPADIVLSIHNIGGPMGDNLGIGGITNWEWRNVNDADQGRRITGGIVSLNANPNKPMGLKARPSKWEFANTTGKDVVQLSLRTRGTDNPDPIAKSSGGAHRFTSILPSNVIGFPSLEDRSHRFTQPVGGTVPPGGAVSVGLTLDTWDWTLVGAIARADDDSLFNVNLVTIFDWSADGQPLPPTPSSINPPNIDIIGPGLDDVTSAAGFQRLAAGFVVVNGEDVATTLTGLALAAVPEMEPTLAMLGTDTLQELARQGRLETTTFAPITLAPGDQFVFVLDGLVDDLPPELLSSGKFLLLNRPELVDQRLFVHVASGAGEEQVQNFTFVNTPLYVPEPALLGVWLLVPTALACRGRRRVGC